MINMKGTPNYRKPCGFIGTFYIAGNSWRIFRVDDPKDDDGNSVYGTTEFDTQRIEIACYLNDIQEMRVFLHELAHAVIHEYHLHLDPKFEERLCDVIGSGFTSALKEWLPQVIRVQGEDE